MSLSKQLTAFHKSQKDWINSGHTTGLDWRKSDGSPYKVENAGRRLRELENDGILACKYENGIAWYKYIPDYARHLYIPVAERTDKMWKDEQELKNLLTLYQYV